MDPNKTTSSYTKMPHLPQEEISKAVPSEPAPSMDEQLHEAAKTGDMKRLHELIEKHPEILDHDRDTSAESALHIAARHGKAIFAVELAIFKPCLKQKLNPSGQTPLHEALKSGKWKTAQALTTLDVGLIRVKDSGGKTALHVAAEVAPPELLAEFLYVCPDSFEDITSRWETAVHCAVEKRNFKNFMVLFRWMVTTHKENVFEWKDFDGNTALHLAAAKMWKEVVEIVIRYVPRETKNFEGKTAMQVLSDQLRPGDDNKGVIKEMMDLLSQPRVNNIYTLIYELKNSLKGDIRKLTVLKTLAKLERWLRTLGFPQEENNGEKTRDVVLVIVTLIATATYQAVVAPPGGYWQEDFVGSPPPPPPHYAGQFIMRGLELFKFTATNASAFYFAVAAILVNVLQLKQAMLLTFASYVLIYNYVWNNNLSAMMALGRLSDWSLYLRSFTLPFQQDRVVPTLFMCIAVFYFAVCTVVAIWNVFANAKDSSARRSGPVVVEDDRHDQTRDDIDD